MNTRAISILAIIQVAVVVFGMLFVGVSHKFIQEIMGDRPLPPLLEWMYNYGAVFLLLPILWVGIALFLRSRQNAPDFVCVKLAEISGIALTLYLIAQFAVASLGSYCGMRSLG